LKALFQKKDKNGRRYTTVPIHAPGETENGKSNQPFKGILPPAGDTGAQMSRLWNSGTKMA
jgi:adenine-specific DNA-methyltransferase